jgi:hypothetical protein
MKQAKRTRQKLETLSRRIDEVLAEVAKNGEKENHIDEAILKRIEDAYFSITGAAMLLND